MPGAIAGDVIGPAYEWRRTKSYDFDLFTPASTPTRAARMIGGCCLSPGLAGEATGSPGAVAEANPAGRGRPGHPEQCYSLTGRYRSRTNSVPGRFMGRDSSSH